MRSFPSGTTVYDILEAIYHLIDERLPRAEFQINATFEVDMSSILVGLTGSGVDSANNPYTRPLKDSDGIVVSIVNASNPSIVYTPTDAANGKLTGGNDGDTGQLHFVDANGNPVGTDSQVFTFGAVEGPVTEVGVTFTPSAD